MLHKLYTKVLNTKICDYKIISKRCSALFINGPKATDSFVYLTPYIDYKERIKENDLVKAEIEKRKIQFDLLKLENLWSVYEELKTRKLEYDSRKQEVSKELEQLLKSKQEGDNVEKLKIQVHLLKENIRKLKEPLWSAEEAAIIEALKLPNKLHNLTPDVDKIIYEHGSKPNNDKDHLKIGKEKNLIHFIKNENYYLKGDAALFELGAKFYFSKILKENNYTQFSNPDFSKSLIIEGCGEDHTNSDSTFILHHNEDNKVNIDSRLHLTGGGSLYSFFAYHAKNVLYAKVLPLTYFSMGRQYIPSPTEEDNLHHVSQSSVVQIFNATRNETELDGTLNNIIDLIKKLYTPLGYHYRLSYVAANQLKTWESLRLTIEMYSSSQKNYMEVGNISLSGDFISKRLMFTYTEEKQSKFPHILSGTILNVPKLLACALEQDGEFILPKQFAIEH
ncbi:serine--tRNA synthetase-like protein Slimp [Vanessa cardui]|uniref:serine--tRNA synthetase-like protein Slimp n=1 Tax=Vanessa cardui TaxID=171605 RepID=UPI001F130B0A|nr:serine--tRNA synthetase-like protein Slimp [Vanessa cardui]